MPFPSEPGSDALLTTEAHHVIAANQPPTTEGKHMSYMPIRKIMATFVAAGIAWVGLRAGVDLGSDEINEAAVAIVGGLAGYLMPDPKVNTAA